MMNDTDQDIIKTKIDGLINKTDYKILADMCVKADIISAKMLTVIEDKNHTESDRHKALFIKITTRADTAFGKLVIICNNRFPEAAVMLAPNNGRNITQELTTKLSPLTEEECAKLPKINITGPDGNANVNRNPYQTLDDEWAGVLFLVNYTENRQKNEQERIKLLSLFNQLNFRLFYLEDKSIRQVHNSIMQLKQTYLKNANCFFYIQLGTGSLNEVHFSDNTAIKVLDVVNAFNNKHCGDLLRKQKVFIFPSVAPSQVKKITNKIDYKFGVAPDDPANTNKVRLPENVSTRSDILYFYFENDGNTFEPSINVFCSKVAEYAYREPLQNILKLYFLERIRAEHSDYREVVDEGCLSPFTIPNLELIRKLNLELQTLSEGN